MSDFNQTVYSTSKMSFKGDRRRDCCSGDPDKLKDVQRAAVNVKKSKSNSKLTSSVPAAQKIYQARPRANKDNSTIY